MIQREQVKQHLLFFTQSNIFAIRKGLHCSVPATFYFLYIGFPTYLSSKIVFRCISLQGNHCCLLQPYNQCVSIHWPIKHRALVKFCLASRTSSKWILLARWIIENDPKKIKKNCSTRHNWYLSKVYDNLTFKTRLRSSFLYLLSCFFPQQLSRQINSIG